MRFKILKNKEKNANSSSNINERTREKFILKGWIESNRKPTCTNKRTRGFLFGAQTRFKMDFSLGRSMVEMLGVLAIIGVLSIGGIQGYTIAMRKHQANEILNSAQKYASVVYTACQSTLINKSLSKGEYYEAEFSYGEDDIDYATVWRCPDLPQYNNVGIGAMPKGLKNIYPIYYGALDNYLRSTRSGDMILFNLLLDSQEVCHTIINTIGTRELGGTSGLCEEIDGGYLVLVNFIMN